MVEFEEFENWPWKALKGGAQSEGPKVQKRTRVARLWPKAWRRRGFFINLV